jgi:hypothetical protein
MKMKLQSIMKMKLQGITMAYSGHEYTPPTLSDRMREDQI